MIDDDIYDSIITIVTAIGLAVIYVFWPSVEWNGIDVTLALKSSVGLGLAAAAVIAVTFKDKISVPKRLRL